MDPKKIDSMKPKRKAVRTTIELKKELIAKFESGTRVSDLATQYDMAKSTISSILKKKAIIKEADVAKGVTVLAVNRSPLIEQMEKRLLVWMKEKQLAGDSISETMICEKAKQLHDGLKRGSLGTSLQSDEFKASRGWLERFKKRSGIHRVVRHREASTNKDAAENSVGEFQNFVEYAGFTPHQVFYEGFDMKPVVEDDIVSLGKSMGLDAEELLKDHKNELITEEQELHGEQQEEVVEELSSSEEESSNESISSAEIKDLCYHWKKTQRVVEKWHPNTAVVNRSINLFNGNVIDYFRKILKNRQRRTTLDRFLEKETHDSSCEKRQKKETIAEREKTPEAILPDVFMEALSNNNNISSSSQNSTHAISSPQYQ